jgi:hypothetical protein
MARVSGKMANKTLQTTPVYAFLFILRPGSGASDFIR